MAHVYNPQQPRAPRGMPRGGQWTSTGNPATLQPRRRLRSANSNMKPRGMVRAKHTGKTDSFLQQRHHDDIHYLIEAHGDKRVHSHTPIPPVNKAKRPSWRMTG